METFERKIFTGERALFGARDLTLTDCIFEDGESPLKESAGLTLRGCSFRWKYPLWYGRDISLRDCVLTDAARAGIWYTENISLTDTVIEAPKTFRRARGINLTNVTMTNAAETLWSCRDITLRNVSAKGDYLLMNAEDVTADHLLLNGNYAFDGAKNVTLRSSKLFTKDAFWNSENVTVYDSYITGEYLGWNAKHLTLVNCTVESLQGFCYIDHLTLQNCKLINTTLAFEYSTVDADITGAVDSVLNPAGGTIRADHIGQLTIDRDRVDPTKTTVIVREDA